MTFVRMKFCIANGGNIFDLSPDTSKRPEAVQGLFTNCNNNTIIRYNSMLFEKGRSVGREKSTEIRNGQTGTRFMYHLPSD